MCFSKGCSPVDTMIWQCLRRHGPVPVPDLASGSPPPREIRWDTCMTTLGWSFALVRGVRRSFKVISEAAFVCSTYFPDSSSLSLRL